MIAIIPDILLLLFPFLMLAFKLFLTQVQTAHKNFAFAYLFILLICQNFVLIGDTQVYFSNWQIDTFGIFMREIFTLSALLALLLSENYFKHSMSEKPRLLHFSEFAASIGFATFGGIVVVSANDLLTLFLGLELATIPMYALVAWNKRDSEGTEAAIKYILMGSVATAFELFGFSYLYGFAGHLTFPEITSALQTNQASPLVWISILFIISGIGFKMTLFPFHLWAPDVYEGAPTPVTAILSVTSKSIAIAFLTVLVFGPLNAIHQEIVPFLALLAGITLLAGNLGALSQSKLRRFMAFSSISQAGYILIALLGNSPEGKYAIIYYLFLYTFSNYLAFFIFSTISKNQSETFISLNGLSEKSKFLAIALLIALMSLAGIPPLAGFFGKLQIFTAAAENKHYFLILFAVLNNVLALYYYIQVLKSAWIDKPAKEIILSVSAKQKTIILILTLSVLLLGFLPFLSNNLSIALL
jgi:NADH-quinone oxidoreductase subunit N